MWADTPLSTTKSAGSSATRDKRPLDEVENSEWLEELTRATRKMFWINTWTLADGAGTLLSEHEQQLPGRLW